MDHLQNFSYRSLERLCRLQAALSSTRATRQELERMASEYAAMADRQERNLAENGQGDRSPGRSSDTP
jgi:hypothetical protein